MSTQHLERTRVVTVGAAHRPRTTVLLWYAAAAVLFFLVPLVGTDRLELQPDLFYLGYFTVAVAFLTAFVSRHAGDLRELWILNLWQSVVIGAVVGATLAVGVFRQAATPHPDGWRFVLEVAWRGVVYGSVDAATLVVLPAAVAYLLMRGDRSTVARKAGFAGLALALSMVVTATYHLGYPEFRDSTIRYPEIGAVAANVPVLVTGNPVGAVVTHATMHVSSVVHQRDGGRQHMLPPRTSGDYSDHGSSDVAAALALMWLVATAGTLALVVRRRAGSATLR